MLAEDEVTVRGDFVDAVRNGTTAAVVYATTGDVLSGVIRDKHQLTLAACQYDEAGSEVASAAALDEQIVLYAFDNGASPIAEEVLINSIAIL